MKGKMFLIVLLVGVLIVTLYFLNSYKNNRVLQGVNNPYGKEDLQQETIDQLKDPLYSNIILPNELGDKLKEKDNVTVYFYSPTCVYCLRVTPVVVPLAREMGIDLKMFNVLEFDEMLTYGIEGTPTIVHFKEGEEFGRISGEFPEDVYSEFFEQNVLSESKNEEDE